MRSKMTERKEASFPHIYTSYKDKIYSYVFYRVNGNRDVTEDLVSDIFLKAYRAFDTYDQSYAVSTWLYTIARNTLIDHYRKHKDSIALEDSEITDTADPLFTLIDSDISLSELHDAIASLPQQQAQYIHQQFIEGYNAKEIAEQAGVSHVAVRKQVSRGMALLREKLLSVFLVVSLLGIHI